MLAYKLSVSLSWYVHKDHILGSTKGASLIYKMIFKGGDETDQWSLEPNAAAIRCIHLATGT